MGTPTILDYYANLPAPKRVASNTETGKAWWRASDYIFDNIIKTLDSSELTEHEHFVRLLAELGINTFGAMVLEHLTKNALGRDPDPELVKAEFDKYLEQLNKTLWQAVEAEVNARVTKQTKTLQERHKDLQCLYESLQGRYEAALELLDDISEPREEIKTMTPVPDRIKVSALAKELNVRSKDVLTTLADMGRDDIYHHAQVIKEPDVIAAVMSHLRGNKEPLTVASVAKQLNISTRELIKTLLTIDHADLNHPSAVIYDTEIVDHVKEVLVERMEVAA